MTDKRKRSGKPKPRTRVAGVYTLTDPETGGVRYIGATKDAHNRKQRHLRPGSNKGTRAVLVWLGSLFAQGLRPIFTLVEETTELEARERHWIATRAGIPFLPSEEDHISN